VTKRTLRPCGETALAITELSVTVPAWHPAGRTNNYRWVMMDTEDLLHLAADADYWDFAIRKVSGESFSSRLIAVLL
jgi:hypothetical protein